MLALWSYQEIEKKKKTGIIFRIRGRPKTTYGPAPKTSSIYNSDENAKINQPEACIVK